MGALGRSPRLYRIIATFLLPGYEVVTILRFHQDSPVVTKRRAGHAWPPPAEASPSSSSIIKICKAKWPILCLVFWVLSSAGWGQQEFITEIVIHGNRRIPAETVRGRIFTRAGDVYDEAALDRDF